MYKSMLVLVHRCSTGYLLRNGILPLTALNTSTVAYELTLTKLLLWTSLSTLVLHIFAHCMGVSWFLTVILICFPPPTNEVEHLSMFEGHTEFLLKKNSFFIIYPWLCWVFVLHRLFSSCGQWAPHCSGLSCGWALGHSGFSSCSTWAH